MTAPVRPDPPRRADIQGLRGLAVLLVVWFHTGQGPTAGFLGVDVFFVISGFVVSRRLMAEAGTAGRVDVAEFYRRRIRRLLPAVAAMIVVVTAATVLLLNPFGPQQRVFRTGGAASVFLANMELYRTTGYFDRSAALNPFLHTWSLSLEEQVFVVLPLLIAVVLRFGPRRPGWHRNTVVVVGAASVLSLVAALVATSGAQLGVEAPGRLAFFSMPTRFWEFGAGILVGLCLPATVRGRWPRLLGIAGLLGIVGLAAVLSTGVRHPGPWTIPLVGATVAVLVSGSGGGPAATLLSWRPVAALGDISYGWYLWHWPALVFCSVLWPDRPMLLLVAAAASVLPAWASYRFLEQPVRTSEWWTPRRTWVLGSACVALPLGVLAGAWMLAQGGLGLQEPMDWYDFPPSEANRCHIINRDAPNPGAGDDCRIDPAAPGAVGQVRDPAGTVMVIGDELANGLVPAVLVAAGEHDMAVVQRTRAGCPYVLGASPEGYDRCEEWQAEVMSEVERLDPALVVLAAQTPRYLSGRTGVGVTDVGGGADAASIDAVDMASGLADTLDRFEELGIPVVLVGPVPDFGAAFPREHVSVLRPEPVEPSLDLVDVVAANRIGLRLLADAAAGRQGVEVLDPVERLCSGDECRAVVEGRWNYLGPIDLTSRGSRTLAPDLLSVMERLLTGSR